VMEEFFISGSHSRSMTPRQAALACGAPA